MEHSRYLEGIRGQNEEVPLEAGIVVEGSSH